MTVWGRMLSNYKYNIDWLYWQQFVSLIVRLTFVTWAASLRSFGILRSVEAVQEEFLDSLTIKDGTDRLFRNVGTKVQFYTA